MPQRGGGGPVHRAWVRQSASPQDYLTYEHSGSPPQRVLRAPQIALGLAQEAGYVLGVSLNLGTEGLVAGRRANPAEANLGLGSPEGHQGRAIWTCPTRSTMVRFGWGRGFVLEAATTPPHHHRASSTDQAPANSA